MNHALRFHEQIPQRIAVLALFCCALPAFTSAQELVNGDFESGASGWTSCLYELNTSNVYGGPNATNTVAEVDGDLTSSPDDDRKLCQAVSGFVIGELYELGFEATRRVHAFTPTTVTVHITIDGGALSTSVSRTGGWDMQQQYILFSATQNTHTIEFSPDFEGSYGMLFDNITIAPAQFLPVELLAFHAEAVPQGVHLAWSTGTEAGTAWFRVERSTDGAQWDAVSQVAAAGYSNALNEYAWHDADPPFGDLLYRLRLEDADGSWAHSQVRTVRHAPYHAACWPNPARDVVRMAAPPEAVDVALIDGTGRLVRTAFSRTDGLLEFPVEACAPGAYHVIDRSTGNALGRFMKQ